MDSLDLEVLRASSQWTSNGRRALLVTVVRTWGSSPRPPGAMMVICDDGMVVGSVSGGCIEDDLIDRVHREGIVPRAPEILTYGVSADEAHRFGLPCGGTIQLVAESIGAHSRIDELLLAVMDGRLTARSVSMTDGSVVLAPAATTEGVSVTQGRFVAVYGPRYRLLVIGAGQLSRYLCEIALGLDYRITVCDPRIEYTGEWTLPGVRLVRTMPDDIVLEMNLDERCAVIALTHDPRLDDLALMEALRTPAFYVGALGSRRNNAARRARLKEFDLSTAQIERLRGPAGIYIGSRTPPEIALSILAEITAMKNGVVLPTQLDIVSAKAAHTEPDIATCLLER